MRVQPERDSWVAVSQLRANRRDAGTTINQRCCDAVPEGVSLVCWQEPALEPSQPLWSE